MAQGEELKVGVFICHCGGNISDVVDCRAVREEARKWPHVAIAREEEYLCSKPAQDNIVKAIEKHGLNRVVVACCTPRMHLPTFQAVMERAGLNPYLLEFVNIREHCSWVHGPKRSEEATRKAIWLVRAGYERALKLEPLEEISEKCSQDVLVIGGGIAGMMASLELANMGYRVFLVERYPSIGGHMAKLTKVFPTIDCAQCILTPRMAEVGRHPNITILANAEVKAVSGYPGRYKARVFVRPRGVDVEACRGCGACERVCPVEVPHEFEEFRAMRKAIYIPFRQAVPYAAVVDFESCTRCGKCVEICPADAIDLDDKGRELELEVGSIIVATGYELYDARKLEEYGYGIYEDVITMMELERLTNLFGPTGGYVKRFSDGQEVRKLAIVLCAGSRDRHRHVPYCSRVCCMYSIKQAVLLREQFDIDVWVFYTDIRAAGRGYEELYWRAEEAGVKFIRGKVAEVWRNKDGRLVVRAEDTLTGRVLEEPFDMVALATPMVAPKGLDELAKMLGLALGPDGFVVEKHPKLNPVDTLKTGIYVCGCATGPKDIRDTVSDALAAAAKAAEFVGKGVVKTSPEKAFVLKEACDGCGKCVEICPVGAIELVSASERKVADINPFTCSGCGACVPECPRGAIEFANYTREQMIAVLKGLLADKGPDEVRVVAFVESTIAYTGADFVGLDRMNYTPKVAIVRVPSVARLGEREILAAFALGADGVVLIEGQHDIYERFVKERVQAFYDALMEEGIEDIRLYESLVELPAYRKIAAIFNEHVAMIEELGPLPEDVREALREKLGL